VGRHNLRTVISFEFLRTVTKKRFWIGTLAVPLVAAIAFALIYVSNSSTSQSEEAQKQSRFSIAYTDASGLITAENAAAFGATEAPSTQAGIRAVQEGSTEAFFAFPARPEAEPVKVYGVDQGVFENGRYSAVAEAMLAQAVRDRIGDPGLSALAQAPPAIDVTTYAGQAESGGMNSIIAPLLYLAVFYGLIVVLAGQMLTSTLEEKENRVTEMILTTLNPTTLITGKVISLFMAGTLQMMIFVSPVVIGYLFFRDRLNFPDVDLSTLVFEPDKMIIGLLILIGGFALFTTSLVALGAVMPTAKEAGSLMGGMIALIFVPFYAISLVVSDPHSVIVQIFTFFPFSAPVTALLRNGLGSLSLPEAGIVLAVLYLGSVVMFRLAVRLFQYGSISYTSRVSIRDALSAPGTRRRAALDGAPAGGGRD
jgi:ABC-2 type transport system permease protein